MRFSLFAVFVHCFTAMIVTAQPAMTDRELAFYAGQVDSLPLFIRSGKAVAHQSGCGMQGHIYYAKLPDGFNMAEDALRVSGRRKTALVRMYAFAGKAVESYNKNQYQLSGQYWQTALAIATDNGFIFDEIHNIRAALNNIYFLAGDYNSAMDNSSAGLATSERINDRERMQHYNTVIGSIMLKLGNDTECRNHFQLSLQLAREIGDTTLEGNALLNLADLYMAESRYPEALDHLLKALALFRVDSLRNHDPVERQAYTYNKLALVSKLTNRLPEAREYSRLALEKAGQTRCNLYDIADQLINAGGIFNRMRLPDSALLFLRKGLAVARGILHREHIRDALEQISESFMLKGRYDSAYQYQSSFVRLNDSLKSDQNQRAILEKETSMRMERQRRQQEETLLQQRTLRNVIIAVALFIIAILALLYNRYRLRQENRYQLDLNRQQVELFNAVASAQEQERKRIAQDIHDGLGSLLSAAKLKMAEVKEYRPDLASNDKFLSGLSLIDEASTELRSISHNIMPATLSKLGLVPALKGLCENVSGGKGVRVEFIAHGLGQRLEETVEITLYRIVLELVNNIVKHARADRASVQLIGYPGHISLIVEDNGVGFQLNRTDADVQGIGLANVAARVDFLKGKMEVDSAPGKGTTIVIEIPAALA